ncbi:MAG: transketolase [Proteobacteria bacterium]|jgi:transketolase|nr:transketolase [Pseudomonadota bacterium]
MTASLQEVSRLAHAIRRRVLMHTLKNNEGYLSQACSSAELLASLYGHAMRLGPSEGPPIPPPFVGTPKTPRATTGAPYNGPHHPDLDRFFFSPVHYSLVLYATLIEADRLAPEALDQFNADGSTVEMIGAEHSPGIEVTAGSLAQCLSQAMGVALARKIKGDAGRNWVFMTDGEFQEGQTWEAFAAAAFHKLGNVAAVVDVNGQQCDGPMDQVMNIEPLADRLKAFGAAVFEVDGHDVEALAKAMSCRFDDRPLVVLGRTDPCRGLDLLRARAPRLHYVRFKNTDERQLYQEALTEMEGR